MFLLICIFRVAINGPLLLITVKIVWEEVHLLMLFLITVIIIIIELKSQNTVGLAICMNRINAQHICWFHSSGLIVIYCHEIFNLLHYRPGVSSLSIVQYCPQFIKTVAASISIAFRGKFQPSRPSRNIDASKIDSVMYSATAWR